LKEEKLGNAEAVGISALIINALKKKTSKDYKIFLGKSSFSFWGCRSQVATFQAHIFSRGC
jgi:hypothetical protein